MNINIQLLEGSCFKSYMYNNEVQVSVRVEISAPILLSFYGTEDTKEVDTHPLQETK